MSDYRGDFSSVVDLVVAQLPYDKWEWQAIKSIIHVWLIEETKLRFGSLFN
jgi:hypothetical protein